MARFHVPKCGGTFLNSLMRLPGACNLTGLNITPGTDVVSDVEYHERILNREYCPGLYFGEGGHSGIGSAFDEFYDGHALALLRQPEQRIISGYYDDFHSWPYWYYNRWPQNMEEYASAVSGCAVKMLTRDGYQEGKGHNDTQAVCGSLDPVTPEEVQLAIKRLRSGFPFVGITEDWDMSVCLLDFMRGGQCVAAEFGNSRPGANTSTDLYDTSELNGFIDIYDGMLYAEAARIYKANLEKYGVTPSSCRLCFQNASVEIRSTSYSE